MIIYSGLGYLVPILYVAPLVVVGSILYYGFGIDVLRTESWWPLHSLILLGTILTSAIGWYVNRIPFEETIYEKTGPVTKLKPRHTLYFLRMEFWGPIILALYVILLSFRP